MNGAPQSLWKAKYPPNRLEKLIRRDAGTGTWRPVHFQLFFITGYAREHCRPRIGKIPCKTSPGNGLETLFFESLGKILPCLMADLDRYPRLLVSSSQTERWLSGRRHVPAKDAYSYGYRGFKSLSFRISFQPLYF